MHTKDNYGWLDSFRLTAALLVIAIHTSPLASFSPEGDFFLTRVLARIAVPFFFMVTGQFVAGKFIPVSTGYLTDENGEQSGRRSFLRYIRKILLLYTAAVILYLPIGIYAGHYQELTILSVLKMLLFDGTFYHLWYFPACLSGILLVYLMSRFLKLRGMLVVSMVLYMIGLLGDSYFGLIQKLPGLNTIYEFFFQICSYTRNGLFFAPLFLTLGVWCAKGSRRGIAAHLIMLILSFLLMTAEAFTLRHFSWQRHDSMYIMLVPVMVSLYRVLLCLPAVSGKAEKRFRSASLWIYVLHPAFIIVVRGAAKFLHLAPLLVDNSLIHYFAVSALSAAAGFGATILAEPVRTFPSPCGRAWIELDKKALARNVEYLRSLMPDGCRLMPAVKANAYGHGAVWTATELNRLGVDAFCVACISEGIVLRKAKVKGEILILGYTAPEDFGLLAHYKLTQTVIDYEYAQKLANSGITLHVHIGIDTGMHRLGIRCEEIKDILAVFEMKNLIIDGMFTHLCACDSPLPQNAAFTEGQIRAFYRVAEILEEQGIPCPRLHLQSSYGLLNYPDLNADYVRAGIALYGVPSSMEDTDFHELSSSSENANFHELPRSSENANFHELPRASENANFHELPSSSENTVLHGLSGSAENADFFGKHLTPVLSLKARVASIRALYAGDSAGYGLAFTAEKDMRIAVLSIGYADGLPRELSCGGGYVLLHGCKAPIIGRICMDQTLIDISGITHVSAGDIAVLIGISGEAEITAVQLAAQCGTITNELLSRLGERLERIERITTELT